MQVYLSMRDGYMYFSYSENRHSKELLNILYEHIA